MEAQTTGTIGSVRVAPLSFQEQLDHARWLRDRLVREVKERLDGVPRDVAAHAYEMAMVRAEKIRLGTDEYRDAALSRESLVHILHQAMRRENKAATIDQADALYLETADAFWIIAEAMGFQKKVMEEAATE